MRVGSGIRLTPIDPQLPHVSSQTMSHGNNYSNTNLLTPSGARNLTVNVNAGPSPTNAYVPPSPAYVPPNAVAGPAKVRTRQVIAPLETNMTSPKARRNPAPTHAIRPLANSESQDTKLDVETGNSPPSMPSAQNKFNFNLASATGSVKLKSPSMVCLF